MSLPSFLMRSFVVVGIMATSSVADVLTVGDDTGGFRTTPWNDLLSIPRFNVGFARLDSVSWHAVGAISARASVRNNSSSSIFPSINANSTVSFDKPSGSDLVNLPVFGSGSSIVFPNSSSSLFAFGDTPADGTIPNFELSQYIGPGSLAFPVSATMGSVSVSQGTVLSRSLTALASLSLTYNYTPIGLTQSDPILPSSSAMNAFSFSGVPSGRWFDPIGADGFLYEMTSPGDTFTSILDFPMGFDAPFFVRAGAQFLGTFEPGESVVFPTGGVRSFTVYGLAPDVDSSNPRAFPLQLAFNRDGVGFRMTPVPEPSILALMSLVVAGVGLRKARAVLAKGSNKT